MFSMQVKGENIRLNDLEKGGGPLYDLGIYCINASRYLFQAEPVEVEAFSTRGNDPRFQNSEEMVSATLRFPGERFAQFTCSFNAADVSTYTVAGTNGELKMESAYEHTSPIIQEITSNGEKDKKKFKKRDQFAAVLNYFSNCILKDQEPEPSGREGLADVRIIEALHRSAQEQKAIALEPFEREHRPSMDQEIEKPPISEQELVHAEPPSRS
jgi:glucose-fructose oxidoreductase